MRGIKEVETWLKDKGYEETILHLNQSGKTAQDAANVIGCEVGQIAKSLVFYVPHSDEAIIIITSGVHQVDKQKVGQLIGKKIKTASPQQVESATGFVPGTVPPGAHDHQLVTLIDKTLFQYSQIWAAAGDTHAVFSISPQNLQLFTHAQIIEVC